MYENVCTILCGLREIINRCKNCVGVLFSYTEVMTDDGVQGVGEPHFYFLIIVVRLVGADHTVPINNRRTRVHSVQYDNFGSTAKAENTYYSYAISIEPCNEYKNRPVFRTVFEWHSLNRNYRLK